MRVARVEHGERAQRHGPESGERIARLERILRDVGHRERDVGRPLFQELQVVDRRGCDLDGRLDARQVLADDLRDPTPVRVEDAAGPARGDRQPLLRAAGCSLHVRARGDKRSSDDASEDQPNPDHAAHYTGFMRSRAFLPTALVLTGAVVWLCAEVLSGQGESPARAGRYIPGRGRGPAFAERRGAEIAAHLHVLSHDLLEGRAPSTRGGQLAAEYLAAHVALLGYEPAGEGGTYFQNVAIQESTVDPSFTLTAGPGAPFAYLKDVVAVSSRLDPTVATEGELVFVGHGIVAPEYRWNDYEGVDMKG